MERWTYGEEDENNHQGAHWDGAGASVLVSSKEKESCQANLLHIHPYEDVLDRLREEQTASLASRWLIELPSKGVLPGLIEQEERETREAIDDGRNEHVPQG